MQNGNEGRGSGDDGDDSEMVSTSCKRWRHTVIRSMAHQVEPLLRCIVKGNKKKKKTHYVTSCSIFLFSQHRNIY